MKKAPIPDNEPERLEAVRRLEELDTEREPAFDRITNLAATLFDVPISLINLIDDYRLWFRSVVGFEGTEAARDISFCGHVIMGDDVMVVPDTLRDPRFSDNPFVIGAPDVRFYAGAPLTTPEGFKVGTLCLVDRRPRNFSAQQKQVLADLAGIVMSEFELRASRRQITNQLKLLTTSYDVLPDGIVLFNTEFRCAYANKAMGEIFGVEPKAILGWTPEDARRYVKTLTSPDDQSIFQSSWRKTAQERNEDQIVVITKPRLRIIRRTLHKLDVPTHPYLVLWKDITYEAEEIARKERASLTDPLTQVPNRRALNLRLAQELSKGAVSVVMFDIDHFKHVNDTYGHPVGDQVLQQVAKTLDDVTRDSDMLGRWGGEEFVAIVAGDLEAAVMLGERAREAVMDMDTPAGKITISAGAAIGSSSDVVDCADKKLYLAKKSGRNRVCS